MRRCAEAMCVVLVFSLTVTVVSAADGEKKKKKKVSLPAAAKGLAGMIQGEVIAVKKGKVTLKVEKVVKVWEPNKAKDPESLIGVEVRVVCRKEDDKPSERHLKFFNTLKPGDKPMLDVANKKGGTLMLLELTEEQRKLID